MLVFCMVYFCHMMMRNAPSAEAGSGLFGSERRSSADLARELSFQPEALDANRRRERVMRAVETFAKKDIRALYNLIAVYGKLGSGMRPASLPKGEKASFGGFLGERPGSEQDEWLANLQFMSGKSLQDVITGVCEGAFLDADGHWTAKHKLPDELQKLWKGILDDQAYDQRMGGHRQGPYAELTSGFEKLYSESVGEWK